MLVACRLAGLSGLHAHYAGVECLAQCGADAAASDGGEMIRLIQRNVGRL